MSRFPTYSVNNQMLIRLQRPNATKVAGYNKWQQFERHVKRGEHGITIIAPTPYKKKIEEQKLDPDTKAPVLEDGKIIEQGTHDQLLGENGLYARLWGLQNQAGDYTFQSTKEETK